MTLALRLAETMGIKQGDVEELWHVLSHYTATLVWALPFSPRRLSLGG